jgi:hypothetical protein
MLLFMRKSSDGKRVVVGSTRLMKGRSRGRCIYEALTKYIFVDPVYGVVEIMRHGRVLIQKRGIYLSSVPGRLVELILM